MSPERLGFVYTFRGNVYELATHPYGCRVLQRCLEHLPEEHTRALLDEMHSYTHNLMQDQFGVGTLLLLLFQAYHHVPELCRSVCYRARETL